MILQRYLAKQFLKTLSLSLVAVVALFLAVDFFERIDNILPEDASFIVIVQYFLFKIPLVISLMLPVSVMVATVFTIGLLSKNSEITAMRAAGLTIAWITRPLYLIGIILSFSLLLLNETLVPYATRRVKEIYNIDIQKKDESGSFSQENFWWRSGSTLYSVGMFDSRTNTLHDLVRLEMNEEFMPFRRTDATQAQFLTPTLGWSMRSIREYKFAPGGTISTNFDQGSTPLGISEQPKDFYDFKIDANTMSFSQLRKFIRTQKNNGIDARGFMADLYEKLASPFLVCLIIPVVLPFALKPARSGSLATSFIAALLIGFSYYVTHSLSLALGRAEIWHPLAAAWTANCLMVAVATVLSLGAESP